MPTIQERVTRATELGARRSTIAWADWGARIVAVWNCQGDQIDIDFSHPQLRMIPFGLRENFKMDPLGRFIQWGNVQFNPFGVCNQCNQYHFQIPHAQWSNQVRG